MGNDELFERAKGSRANNSSPAQRGAGSGGGEFNNLPQEPMSHTALVYNRERAGFKQVRLLGNPIEARNDDPFSPRVIYTSMIKGDDGKKFRCVWPSKADQPDWILWKVFTKVMSFTYNRAKQAREYHYQDQFPDLFNRVSKNDDLENPYESGWYPKASIIQNVIDRDSMDWHRENGRTLLLSRKGRENDEGTIFYEPGYPPTVYNLVWDQIVEWAGSWENYDVVIEKLEDDPWYAVYHPTEDKRRLSNKFTPEEEFVERELTEEELSWTRVNLDEVFRLTSYVKIDNRLGAFIKKVDKKLNTNFYPDFKEEVEAQRKEFERLQQEAEKSVTSAGDNPAAPESENSSKPAETTPKTDTASEEGVSETPRKRRRHPRGDQGTGSQFNLDDYVDRFPGVQKLSEKERQAIVGFDEDRETFIYGEDESGKLMLCPESDEGKCSMDSPDWFAHCPGCGVDFEEE